MFNETQSPILVVRDLTTRLQIGHDIWTVVDHLGFSLYRGKTLALVGESGCGKSMTALSLLRILPHPPALPPTGEVIYQERNLLQLDEKEMRKIRGAKIAMIFQDPMSALNPVYTVGNQLVEVAELHLDLYGEQAWARARDSLEAVGIADAEERLKAYPHQLSGGLKQRVMIAMALMCEPDILIADEPTTAIDVTIQAQVLDLIRSLQREKGMALLLITHDMGVVAEMADDVIVMYLAQGVERATAEDLFDYPSHPYTIGLFQSRPSLENRRGKLLPISGQVPTFRHIPAGCRFHPRCPYVMEKCRRGVVPDFVIQNPSHQAKCWLYDGSQESQERWAHPTWEETNLFPRRRARQATERRGAQARNADHRRQLLAQPVLRVVERQPARRTHKNHQTSHDAKMDPAIGGVDGILPPRWMLVAQPGRQGSADRPSVTTSASGSARQGGGVPRAGERLARLLLGQALRERTRRPRSSSDATPMRPARSEATRMARVASSWSASSSKARIEMKIATVKPMPLSGAMAAIAAQSRPPGSVVPVTRPTPQERRMPPIGAPTTSPSRIPKPTGPLRASLRPSTLTSTPALARAKTGSTT